MARTLDTCAPWEDRAMEITLQPKKVALTFFWVVMALTLIHSTVLFFYYYLKDEEVFGLVDIFDFDIEGNVPTLYSTVALLFCSALLAIIARSKWKNDAGWRKSWLGLAAIFLYLAIDEGVGLHEYLSEIFEKFMQAEGLLYFLWVVPYGIATAFVGLIYLRFVLNLPKRTRALFVVAGVIFLTGAVGIEMLSAREVYRHSSYTITYGVLYTFEELFEMLGIVLFIYALLSYMVRETGRLSIIVELPSSANSGLDTGPHDRR
jgi:sulfur relay (sulfurtransferase) DsrF/TusC family protein